MGQYQRTIRHYLLLVGLQVALTGWGCATTPPYTKNPFIISKEEFKTRITTVVLEPLTVPDGLKDQEQVVAQFESLMTKKLVEAGFSVLNPQQVTEISQWSREQVGGVFDPVTGKRDESRFATARKLCLEELRTKYHADAVVCPSIQIAKAKFQNCWAKWDGVEEEISPVYFGVFCGSGNVFGSVPALSLVVRIENMDGRWIYLNGGGIQVLSRIKTAFIAQSLTDVDRALLFANRERNQTAVNIALGPLLP